MDNKVYLRCVKVGSRLRIKITSKGYNNEANCQFPRALRQEGLNYSIPSSALSFAKGPSGKFFYRVKKKDITVLDAITVINQGLHEIKIDKVYEDGEDCLVCMDKEHEVVIIPCGHYCLCHRCAESIQKSSNKCPLCRGKIHQLATRDMIMT